MWRRSEPIHTSYCQAQPKPRPKLGAELVLISNNPATNPSTRKSMKELEFKSDQKAKFA